MSARVASAASAAALAVEKGEGRRAVAEREAARFGVRLLLIDANGDALAAADHDAETSLRDRAGDLLFGPEGAPTLHVFDSQRPAIQGWPEVVRARSDGRSEGCEVALAGALLVCHVATARGGEVVLAQKSSPRAIRALSDQRYALLKLTLYVLVIGALLAAWLGRRILSPVEKLRDMVQARVQGPLHAPPIPRVSNDEIGDLGEAFNALLAALSAKSRANEAFAADLAHELKSPIAALRACAEGITGPLNAERAERLARLLTQSTARMDTLISRFLDLARAEAGLTNEPREATDLTSLLRGICGAFADDERWAGVRFEVTGEAVEALVARVPFEAALRNILENAASFAGKRGTVRGRTARDQEHITIEITDSGPGIAEANLPRIFDRFFTDRPDGKGTGLGLAYAKAVVLAHGGSILAESPPGEGAVVTLLLPAVSQDFHTHPPDVSHAVES